jgi:preprotein translocase subunit YajC
VFVLVPQRRATRAKLAMQDSIDVGDEIVTAGGLYGYVTALGDDELDVEIAPGTVVRIATRAIAAVIEPDEDEADEDESDEEGPDAAGADAAHAWHQPPADEPASSSPEPGRS